MVNFPVEGLDLEDRVAERRIANTLNLSDDECRDYGIEPTGESLVYDLCMSFSLFCPRLQELMPGCRCGRQSLWRSGRRSLYRLLQEQDRRPMVQLRRFARFARDRKGGPESCGLSVILPSSSPTANWRSIARQGRTGLASRDSGSAIPYFFLLLIVIICLFIVPAP